MRPNSPHQPAVELVEELSDVSPLVVVPHKLDVQFSRIQLSRRRYPLSGDGRDQRDKIKTTLALTEEDPGN
jgi:hypothetical protein